MKFFLTLMGCMIFSLLLTAQSGSSTGSRHDTIPSSIAAEDSLNQRILEQQKQIAEQMTAATINYFVIKAPNGKFGYTIFINSQMYINQKTIPAMPGNEGFATKEDAEKVAKLVIKKIYRGEMPPTITVEDLKQLKVIPE